MSNPLIQEYGEPVELTTRAPGAFVNGSWVPGSITTLTITAAVFPATSAEDQTALTDAGLEDRSGVIFYTEHAVKKSAEDTSQERDVLRWQGRDYVVLSSLPRNQIPDLAHYKVLAALKGS